MHVCDIKTEQFYKYNTYKCSFKHMANFILCRNRALIFFVFRTIRKRGRFVEYPSYHQMTSYIIFDLINKTA